MPTPKFGRAPKFGRQPEAQVAQVAASDASAEVVSKPAARMTIGGQLRRPLAKPDMPDASDAPNSVTVDTILEERMASGLRRLGREADPYLAYGKPTQTAPTITVTAPPTVYDSDGSPITSLSNIDGQITLYADRGESWDLEGADGTPLALQVGDLAHRQWHDFDEAEQDALRARFPNAPEKSKTNTGNTGGIGRVSDLIQAGLVTPDAPGVPGRPT